MYTNKKLKKNKKNSNALMYYKTKWKKPSTLKIPE